MRRFLLGLAASAAIGTFCAVPDQAHSQVYPWCRSRAGGTNCYFSTRQQCLWALSGGGGYCHPNTFYNAGYQAGQPGDARPMHRTRLRHHHRPRGHLSAEGH